MKSVHFGFSCTFLRHSFFISTLLLVMGLALPAIATSNTGLVFQGRIVDPTGTAVQDSSVQFLLQVYGTSSLHGDGTAGSDSCLLYQETQTLNMSNSSGTFALTIGQGSSPQFGSGVTSLVTVFRNPQTSTPSATEAIGAISCTSGQTKFLSSSWDNNRQLMVTVTTSSAVLNLAAVPLQAVPYAEQALQVGGYSSDYLMRVQASRPGSGNSFTANQFDFLLNLGINAVTPGNPSTYQVTNLLANDPVAAQQVATKNYVDNQIASVAAATVQSDGVTLQGDGSSANKLAIKDGGVSMAKLAQGGASSNQVLQWNGSQWVPTTLSTMGQALTSANIWVGNGSNLAEPVAASGDVSLNPAGKFTVTGLQGQTVSGTAPTSGQILQYNGSSWVAAPPTGTTVSGGTSKVLSMFNTTGDNVINSSVTDNGAGGVNFANSYITFNGSGFAKASGESIYIGESAGTATGGYSTALGHLALSSNTGNYNTAVGDVAMQSNTTGQYNIAMGLDALRGNISGSYNTALGSQSLWDNTTGSNNSAVGNSALQHSTGNSNTAMGYQAGLNLASGDGNVYLGKASGPAASSTQSNKLYIHNASSDTPLIGGDFSTGTVQINSLLEVPLSSSTPTPDTGYGSIYAKADGNLYFKNASTEYQLSGAAATGVTSLAATAPLSVSAASGAVTASMDLASTHIYVGNGSNLAADVAMSGDASIDNTGKISVTGIQGKSVTLTSLSSGQILQYNGSQWLNITPNYQSTVLTDTKFWVGNSSNVASPVSAGGDVTMDDSGAFTVNKINGTTVAGVGLLNNDLLQNVSGSTLAANTLLVTNGTDTGVTAVPAQNSAVLITNATGVPSWSTSATATGQVLQYNGSAWVPATLSSGTAISGGTTKVLSMFNPTGDNVINSSITDNGASGVNFANKKITFGGSNFIYTDANANTSMGINSLPWTTSSGNNNTVFGNGAGSSIATSASTYNNNTMIGSAAGSSVTTGGQNVLVGASAGNAGNYGAVVAVGSAALRYNTANYNTAVGQAALYAITTGGQNVAVGTSAGGGDTGSPNSTQGDIVAIGYQALWMGGGDENTAVGSQSLISLTTGAQNTAVGYRTGAQLSGTSAGNVMLGYNAGPATSATYSNKLYINNSQSDTPLLSGDFSAGYVQINNQLELPLSSTTPSPNTGYGRVYAKADGNLYYKNTSTEYQLNGAGTTISGGTTKVLPMFNATGNNVVNSSVTDNGTGGVNFANSVITFNGNLFAHATNDVSNAFVGVLAGNTTTTGYSNAAMGGQALNAITSGRYNAALGYGALQTNTTGHDNTAVGFGTLPATITGQNNTAVGSLVLNQNTGNYNSGVGTSALSQNQSGSNNTALGSSAGVNINGASTGNLFLGYRAGPTTIGAINSKLYINNAQSDTPLIGGDFSAGYVQINNQLELPLSSTTPTPTAGYGRVYAKADGNLYYKNASTEYQINSSGPTGSGTTNYLAKWSSSSAVTSSVIYDNGTNVGIGTTGPGAKLEVVGDAKATRFYAYGAGGVTTNAAFGTSSLNANTSGGDNTAIGSSALQANTDGWRNTAVGTNALSANTTTYDSTAVGAYALQNSTGAYNTAVGSYAMGAATSTGSNNAAFGEQALQNVTSGNNNTGLGYQALGWITTGSNNIAIGYGAGESLPVGAIGTVIIGSHYGSGLANNTILLADGQGNERMRIDSSGHVGINNGTPGYTLDVGGDTNIAAGSALRFAGTSVCTSAGCTSSSDRRLKENILPLQESLNKVLQLQGVSYDYKDKAKYTDRHQIGVIAQDVEKVFPEVVVTDKKTGLKSVAYDHLVAPLIEAVKNLYQRWTEMQARQDQQAHDIASIKEELVSLKAENKKLHEKIENLERKPASAEAPLSQKQKHAIVTNIDQ